MSKWQGVFAPSEPIHSVLSFPLLPGKPKSDHLTSYSNKKVIYVSCWTDSHPILSSESLLSSSTAQSLFIHCSCFSLVGFWSMHSLFPFLQNSHPRLSYHSTNSFALQKYCPNSHGHMGLLFLFKHSFLSFSTLNHPPKLRTAFRKILIYGI